MFCEYSTLLARVWKKFFHWVNYNYLLSLYHAFEMKCESLENCESSFDEWTKNDVEYFLQLSRFWSCTESMTSLFLYKVQSCIIIDVVKSICLFYDKINFPIPPYAKVVSFSLSLSKMKHKLLRTTYCKLSSCISSHCYIIIQ